MSQSSSDAHNPAGRRATSELYGRETFRPRSDQVADVEQLVEDGVYPNRSEFYRAAVDRLLAAERRRERESE